MVKRNNNKFNKKRAMASTKKTETKLYDLQVSNTISTAFVIYPLHAIFQGISYNERIGLSVNLEKLHQEFTFRAGSALIGSSTATVRMMIVCDTQQIDNLPPTGLEVLSTNDPRADYNWFNISRFKIIHNSMFTLDQYHPNKVFSLKKNLRILTKFSGVSGANITKNGIYIILLSDNSVNPPDVQFWSRTLYGDP